MPETLLLELGPSLRVEWRLDELLRSADTSDAAAAPAWSAKLDWSGIESLRLISGAAGDDALAIVVARPRDAAHHDEDLVAGVRAGAAGVESAEEVLLSTEYDPEGRIRRIGAELWLAGGTGTRMAADRAGDDVESHLDDAGRTATPMSFRLGGSAGTGMHELVRPT